MKEINELVQGMQNTEQYSATEQLFRRELGPLNEWSRSLLHADLSDETRQKEEARLAKMERKRRGLRERKPYTRGRGCVHPKRKEATERRRLRKKWADEPMNCINNAWGCWKLDKSLWDLYVQPLWSKYKPEDLTWKRNRLYHRKKGNRAEPYDLWCFNILYKKTEVVYDGEAMQLYWLSTPKVDSNVSSLDSSTT